jgi:DNA-binding NarL/FixJ family response regulator
MRELRNGTEPITIVLAEHQRMFRELLHERLIAISGIRIAGSAGSGEETLKVVSKVLPRIVILNAGLPGLNAIRVTKKICALYPSIRIIVIGPSSDSVSIKWALEAGAKAFVSTLGELAELEFAIGRVIKGGTFLCAQAMSSVVNPLLRKQMGGQVKFQSSKRIRCRKTFGISFNSQLKDAPSKRQRISLASIRGRPRRGSTEAG